MRRALHIALGALTLATAASPGAARAQLRTTPMVIPAPGEGSTVVAQAFTSSAAQDADLLVLYGLSGASRLRPHEDLASSIAPPMSVLLPFRWARAGRLAPLAGDALPDVAYCNASPLQSQLAVAYGHANGVLVLYDAPLAPLNTRQSPTFSFAHLLERDADFLVMPQGTGSPGDTSGMLWALDFDPLTTALSKRAFPVPARTSALLPDEVLPMRIGANARARGVDDLYMLGQGSVTIFENLSPPSATDLAGIALGPGVRIGGTASETDLATWLPDGVPLRDAQGAAPLDVDGDGILDLVVSLSTHIRYPGHEPGHLLWVRGDGTIAGFAGKPWADLNADLGLSDPVVARPLAVEGEPAVALWDRGLDQIVVVRAGPAGVRIWRGEARGHRVADILLADVVGSSAPDLVANATGRVESDYPPSSPAVLVYPDLGDASPRIAWAPGSPGAPARGQDLPLAVAASDADGPFRVDWFVGDPWTASPAASGDALTSWTFPGASLCSTPPQQLSLTVRAVDGLGVWDEIAATLDVAETPPRIEIAGASSRDRLALEPTRERASTRPVEGWRTEALFDGSAWSRCPVTLAWSAGVWPAAATLTVDPPVAGVTRLTVVLPEAAYPELLAGASPVVSLTATDPALPAPQTTAMPVAVDASGLVEIEHGSDVPAIGEGDVAVLTTRLRSRIGVALPAVRVIDALEGLAPAGPPRAAGAAIAEVRAQGGEVVLDALPPAGAEVVIELPVRSVGDRHASAAEVRSAGGHLLTPPASAPAAGAPLPGCGCGSSSPGAAALALLVLALRRPRARAKPFMAMLGSVDPPPAPAPPPPPDS